MVLFFLLLCYDPKHCRRFGLQLADIPHQASLDLDHVTSVVTDRCSEISLHFYGMGTLAYSKADVVP